MTCEKIEQWLLQELGEEHSDDIKKLYGKHCTSSSSLYILLYTSCSITSSVYFSFAEKHIDGVVFPTLTENDLKTEIGIESFAFRRKISVLVQVIFYRRLDM